MLLSLWTVAVFTIWLRAHLKLSHYENFRKLEKPSRYKAALKLSESIDHDFEGSEDPSTTTNKQFHQHVEKTLNGGRVRGQSLSPTGELRFGIKRGLKNWFKKEKWWASFLMLDLVWIGVGWMIEGLSLLAALPDWLKAAVYWLALWAWPSIVFALILGTTRNSRLFFVISWVSLGVAVLFPLFGALLQR